MRVHIYILYILNNIYNTVGRRSFRSEGRSDRKKKNVVNKTFDIAKTLVYVHAKRRLLYYIMVLLYCMCGLYYRCLWSHIGGDISDPDIYVIVRPNVIIAKLSPKNKTATCVKRIGT